MSSERRVLWMVAPSYPVVMMLDEAEYITTLMDEYDALAFWWPVGGGYIVGLLRRSLWEALN